MQRLKRRKKAVSPDILDTMVMVRVSNKDWMYLNRQALKYTDGNISEYVRYAALAWAPSEGDLEAPVSK